MEGVAILNRTEKIMKVIGWIDEGENKKASDYFCKELDDEERGFIFSLLQELRALRKQKS